MCPGQISTQNGYSGYTTGVPEGMINIMGGHSISHSEQKIIHVYVPYS
jgi:hypothetical protein